LDLEARVLTLVDGRSFSFALVCAATGARPRAAHPHPAVRVLRDTDSVHALAAELRGARRVVIAGNGGIALGLAAALSAVDVVWAAKQGHVGDAFFDADAAAWLARRLVAAREGEEEEGGDATATTAKAAPTTTTTTTARAGFSAAAGPGWADALAAAAGGQGRRGALDVRLFATVSDVASPGPGDWPLTVTLSTGDSFPADAVVSAVGVAPDTAWLPASLARAPDGGLWVDTDARASHPALYAAGDAATVRPDAAGAHWFQMRLWTQARALGALAGAAMAGVPPADRGLSLELFAHATTFAGARSVLLGRYDGQGLEKEDAATLASYVRETDAGFARILLHRGAVAGAVLLGEDAEMAGVLEDLILDGVDVSFLGARLLDPDLDLDAVFD